MSKRLLANLFKYYDALVPKTRSHNVKYIFVQNPYILAGLNRNGAVVGSENK